MAKSAEKFAELLTSAVYQIKALEGKSLSIIQDELAFALNKESGESSIGYWRKGHIPGDLADVERLARELVCRRGIDEQKSCEQFLAAAGHPQAKEMAKKLLPTGVPPPLDIRPDAPFVVGPPITHPRQFFGRMRELQRVFGWWRGFPMEHVTIIGARRSGKTSLLHYLRTITITPSTALRARQKRDWLPEPQQYRWIWIDFQNPTMRKLTGLLRHLLTGFALEIPDPCNLDTFMDLMTDYQWQRPTIILMDELGAGLNAAELPQDFWWSLRSLVNAPNAGNLAFVLAAHESPTQLAEERGKTSPFFNMFNTLELGPFTETEARELIASSPLPFTESDTTWILAQSKQWPCLLQILCQERLSAIEDDATGDEWQAKGLRRLEPFHHLLEWQPGA